MNSNTKKMNFSSIIKNIFFLLLILQFTPMVLINLKKYFTQAIIPKTYVGRLNINNIITDANFYVKQIKKFYDNDDIAALFLKIDCPGGTPGSSQAVFEEIKRFKEKKPVVVLTENVCASGGYYMAAAANKIVAPASALVGSIGVYMQLPNIKKLLDKWNISFNFIQSGKYKTAGSPLKEIDPEDFEYLQNLADKNYKQFIKDISLARKLDLKTEKNWANGKVFLASQAQKLGLIDEIGSQSKAEEILKKLANIKNKIKFVTPKRQSSLAKLLIGNEDIEEENQYMTSKISSFLANILHKTYLYLSIKNSNVTL